MSAQSSLLPQPDARTLGILRLCFVQSQKSAQRCSLALRQGKEGAPVPHHSLYAYFAQKKDSRRAVSRDVSPPYAAFTRAYGWRAPSVVAALHPRWIIICLLQICYCTRRPPQQPQSCPHCRNVCWTRQGTTAAPCQTAARRGRLLSHRHWPTSVSRLGVRCVMGHPRLLRRAGGRLRPAEARGAGVGVL